MRHKGGSTAGNEAGPTSPSLSALPREVYVLSAMGIVVALGFGIISPAIPLLAKHFGVGHAVAGLAISSFAFARFVSAYGNGRIIERLGERPVLIAGLALQAIMMVLAGLSPNYTLVIVYRGIAGLGSAAFTVSSLSMVLRLAPPTLRGRAASVYQGGFLVGAVGGPAIGGVLTEISPRLPFVTYGVCLAVAGVVGTAMLPRLVADREVEEHFEDPILSEHSEEGQGIHYPVTVAAGHPLDQPHPLGLKSRAFAAALAINLGSGWMLYGVRNALVPAYVTDQLHHTAVWAGGAFFVASLIQVLVLVKAGGLADTWGRKPTMIIGAISALVASIVLVLPANTGAFLLSMAGLGVAAAFISSSPAAVVGDVAQGVGGRGVALFSMASDFGAVVGPLLAGYLADRYSYSIAFLSGVVVLSFSLGACLIMQETKARSPMRDAQSASTAGR